MLLRYVLEVSILLRTTPGPSRMSAHNPEAAADDSSVLRASPARAALSALGLAGAVLCVVATFSAVIRVEVLTVEKASYSGYDRHSVALLLIGAFAALMAYGALRGARPAMAALAACGLAVLLIALLGDLPHLDDAGVWPESDAFEDASARAGAGWYLETAAGVLLLASGVLTLLVRERAVRPARAVRRSRPSRQG